MGKINNKNMNICYLMNKITNFIRYNDDIAKPSLSKLHVNGDKTNKTVLGGLASLFIWFYIIFVTYFKLIKMFGKIDAY